MSKTSPDIITTGKASKILGCSPTTIVSMINSGSLHAWPVGKRKHLRLHRAEVEAYRDRNSNTKPMSKDEPSSS